MIRPGPTAILGLALCLVPAVAMVRGPGGGLYLALGVLAWLLITAITSTRLPRSDHLLLVSRVQGTARLGSTVILELELTNLHFQRLRLEGALIHDGTLEFTPPRLLTSLGPGDIERHRVTLRPLARGLLNPGYARVCVRGWLGWLERVVDLPIDQEILVHPRPVSPRLLASLIPMAPPSQRHPCTERELFRALRPSLPGDDARDLSWSASARAGSPVVRTWEAPRAGPVVILLDRGAGMSVNFDPLQSRLDVAVAMASGLARSLHRAGHPVTLAAWSAGLDLWIPSSSRGTTPIELALATLSTAPSPWDPGGIAAALSHRLPTATTVLILTEPDGEPEALANCLAVLRGRATPWVVLVGDPGLAGAARVPVQDLEDVYRCCAALALGDQRRAAMARWRAAGAIVSDASGRAGALRQPVLM